MIYPRLLIMLMMLGILLSESVTAVERSGDIIQVALPVVGLGATYYLGDNIGRKQFWSSFLSSMSLTYLLKYTIDKERPNGHCCESFPSGHTAAAFSGAMFINNRYGMRYGIPSLLLASFVGYSRVYADKHYWEDVIAGASISIASNIIFTKKGELNRNNLIRIGYLPTSNRVALTLHSK